MRHVHALPAALLIGIAAFVSPLADAGPYADDMAKCFVNKTEPSDRSAFIKWLFASMALHPDVISMANVTDAQRDVLNKSTAALFQRLLLESCGTETRQAVQYEGPQTIQVAFALLGQVAGQELFVNPKVAEGMNGVAKFFDEEKFKSLMMRGAASGDAPASGAQSGDAKAGDAKAGAVKK